MPLAGHKPFCDQLLRSLEKADADIVAAGHENHLWEVVHGLYLRQGPENAGWVSDDVVAEIAAAAGLDGDTLRSERLNSSVETEIRRSAAAAEAAGVQGTPAFEVGPTGGRLELVQVSSLEPEGIVPAIEAVLAR